VPWTILLLLKDVFRRHLRRSALPGVRFSSKFDVIRIVARSENALEYCFRKNVLPIGEASWPRLHEDKVPWLRRAA
jgi:hypothetical protein